MTALIADQGVHVVAYARNKNDKERAVVGFGTLAKPRSEDHEGDDIKVKLASVENWSGVDDNGAPVQHRYAEERVIARLVKNDQVSAVWRKFNPRVASANVKAGEAIDFANDEREIHIETRKIVPGDEAVITPTTITPLALKALETNLVKEQGRSQLRIDVLEAAEAAKAEVKTALAAIDDTAASLKGIAEPKPLHQAVTKLKDKLQSDINDLSAGIQLLVLGSHDFDERAETLQAQIAGVRESASNAAATLQSLPMLPNNKPSGSDGYAEGRISVTAIADATGVISYWAVHCENTGNNPWVGTCAFMNGKNQGFGFESMALPNRGSSAIQLIYPDTNYGVAPRSGTKIRLAVRGRSFIETTLPSHGTTVITLDRMAAMPNRSGGYQAPEYVRAKRPEKAQLAGPKGLPKIIFLENDQLWRDGGQYFPTFYQGIISQRQAAEFRGQIVASARALQDVIPERAIERARRASEALLEKQMTAGQSPHGEIHAFIKAAHAQQKRINANTLEPLAALQHEAGLIRGRLQQIERACSDNALSNASNLAACRQQLAQLIAGSSTSKDSPVVALIANHYTAQLEPLQAELRELVARADRQAKDIRRDARNNPPTAIDVGAIERDMQASAQRIAQRGNALVAAARAEIGQLDTSLQGYRGRAVIRTVGERVDVAFENTGSRPWIGSIELVGGAAAPAFARMPVPSAGSAAVQSVTADKLAPGTRLRLRVEGQGTIDIELPTHTHIIPLATFTPTREGASGDAADALRRTTSAAADTKAPAVVFFEGGEIWKPWFTNGAYNPYRTAEHANAQRYSDIVSRKLSLGERVKRTFTGT